MVRIKALRFLLSAVEKIQFELALENIWIRGGVSQGELSHNDRNVIGHGLVNAYLLETKASFPRVLVDPLVFQKLFESQLEEGELKPRQSVLSEINMTWSNSNYSGRFIFDWKHAAPINDFTQDYPFFVNYLNPLLVESNTEFRDKLFVNLAARLYQNEPSVYRKYRWVCDYIRSMVAGEANRRVELKKNEFESDEEFQKRTAHDFLDDYLAKLQQL